MLYIAISKLITKTFSTFTRAVEIYSSSMWLHLKPIKTEDKLFLSLIKLLKRHTLMRYNNLTELTFIDTPASKYRFTLVCLFTSVEFSNKLNLAAPLAGFSIPSIASIYPNSSWSEREARDMFGVFFTNNVDLRRLLTDYGFEGFPLRKDFPLTGYLEVRYDDEHQRIIYEPVELAQEFRVFQLSSPWENKK